MGKSEAENFLTDRQTDRTQELEIQSKWGAESWPMCGAEHQVVTGPLCVSSDRYRRNGHYHRECTVASITGQRIKGGKAMPVDKIQRVSSALLICNWKVKGK